VAHPDLHIQLVPAPRSFSLSHREADVAVMVGRPEKERLRVRRLAGYTFGVYSTKSYLDSAGHPETLTDLRDHTLVGYAEDLIYTPELNYTPDFIRDWHSPSRYRRRSAGSRPSAPAPASASCTTSLLQGSRTLSDCSPSEASPRSYWTVWHEKMRVARRLQAVVDLIDVLVREERDRFEHPPPGSRAILIRVSFRDPGRGVHAWTLRQVVDLHRFHPTR
jgi:DNA-binding transcriptional LysR family regulator